MRWTRSEAATAETKKAEGASCTALRTPSPPIFTGRVACVHAGLSSPKWMFVIPLRDDFRSPSYSCSTGERKQGAVLRLYKSFGRAKECFRRRMASWAGRSWSLSPIFLSMSVLDVRMSEMEDTSPTGDPSKVAFAGSTIWAPFHLVLLFFHNSYPCEERGNLGTHTYNIGILFNYYFLNIIFNLLFL